ncbi:C-type lectin domain family 12 member B-like [Hypanus sabinus]|uniref:C-type lectin domain family 12 member B-like n=1 Tax=Hypanus sabinus TaxID=79690 RepID=UPI0028C431D6|nr:C-type lectin domain family 12 member B-like [Hypanus sabinus]
MDDSETHMNKKPRITGSRAPSRDHQTSTYTELNILAEHQTSTYTELNIRKGERLTNTHADGLDPTYSQLNLRNNELLIAKDEDPPVTSSAGEKPVTAQAGPHKQEPNENIGNRPDRKICLHSLVTSVLFVAVVGLSIYVSQIRQSQITSSRNLQLLREEYREMNRTQRQCRLQVLELNSTLESTISENSLLNLTQGTCLNYLSALNSNLSVLKRRNTELRNQVIQVKKKYRSANETKAQICQLLTGTRVHPCPQNWINNGSRCYFISSMEKAYDGAREHCSNFNARLLEINSKKEEDFVSTSIGYVYRTYWIGKCRDGNVDSNVLDKSFGWSSCSKCNAYRGYNNCKSNYRFICEKSDIPAEIRGLCQHPVEKT